MKIVAFIFSILFGASWVPTERGDLLIQLENIRDQRGCIRIAVYEDSNFLDDELSNIEKILHKLEANKQTIRLSDVKYGEYAVAVYHDLNDNDRLDKNALGIPVEPYAFSNNPKIKWKAPSFKATKFSLSTKEKIVRLELKSWKEH